MSHLSIYILSIITSTVFVALIFIGLKATHSPVTATKANCECVEHANWMRTLLQNVYYKDSELVRAEILKYLEASKGNYYDCK